MRILGNITRALLSANRTSVMEMVQQEFGVEISEGQAEAVIRGTRCRMGHHDARWCGCQAFAEQNRAWLASLSPDERRRREDAQKRVRDRNDLSRVEPCDTDTRIFVKTILINLGVFGNGGRRYTTGRFAPVLLHFFPIHHVTDEQRRRAWRYYDEWKELVGVATSGIERTSAILTPIDRVARRVTRMIDDKYHPNRDDFEEV